MERYYVWGRGRGKLLGKAKLLLRCSLSDRLIHLSIQVPGTNYTYNTKGKQLSKRFQQKWLRHLDAYFQYEGWVLEKEIGHNSWGIGNSIFQKGIANHDLRNLCSHAREGEEVR
jgi:hypothetical protein